MKPVNVFICVTLWATLFLVALSAAGIATIEQPARMSYVEADVGTVEFGTTCSPEADKIFNLAMAFQDDYWFTEARRHFEAVVQTDPSCAIAYWGLGNTLLANAFSPTPTENLPAGLAMVKKGQAIGTKGQREDDLLNALAVYYTDYDKYDESVRLKLYGRAMKQVAIHYPADDEVQIAYALALLVGAPASDLHFSSSRQAAAILEKIAKRRPRRAFLDPRLRCASFGARRAICGALLSTDCTTFTARPAHAGAYLHPGWALARLHHGQYRLGKGSPRCTRARRRAALRGLSRLRLSASCGRPEGGRNRGRDASNPRRASG